MNLAGIIDRHPDEAPALVTGTGEITSYRDLRRAVVALHQRLAAAGLGPDDRVAILSANHPDFVVGYLAVLRCGAVAVPLNVVSPPAELHRQLAEVDAAAILVGPGGEAAANALGSTSEVRVLPVPSGAAPPSEDPSPPPPLPDPVDRAEADVAALLFTAGTAGAPRAAMLTHANLLANLDQVQRHPGPGIDAADRVLAVLPLSHIFGLNAVLGEALFVGASVVLVDHFDPAGTLDVIARQGVTVLVGPPTLYAALAAAPPAAAPDDDAAPPAAAPDDAAAPPAAAPDDAAAAPPAAPPDDDAAPPAAAPDAAADARGALASVRFAFSGAAPLSTEVAEAWQKRFGLTLRQGYGLTEASPVVTAAVMDEPARAGSIGVPLPGVEVRLVDEDGGETLAGDPGEILVRGPNVFPGYWRDAGATESVLTTDGWLRTGDIAVVGDDGELSIVDRAKDLIIVAGFNVYPAEVEEVLAEHPAVADVAVVGDADPVRGETVHAFVVLRTPAAATSESDLNEWCRLRLARYKCPSEITFLDALPHGLAGKLLRRALRSEAEGSAAEGPRG